MVEIDGLVQRALDEDAARRDLTAEATIAAQQAGRATIAAKAGGVLSGINVASRVFALFDAAITCQWQRGDGDRVAAGDRIAMLAGPLRSLLSAERTALNFIQHLSGIATATQAFVAVLEGTGCAVVDTRKTTPGLRHLEKQAVLHGGGGNHRMDLVSGMLIKENHIAGAGSLSAAVQRCRSLQQADAQAARAWIEVECETMQQVREAVDAAPDIILLDNMSPAQCAEARALVPGGIVLEASGNISLHNARAYAETGVDRIAIGGITHSAPALDISMRVEAAGEGA